MIPAVVLPVDVLLGRPLAQEELDLSQGEEIHSRRLPETLGRPADDLHHAVEHLIELLLRLRRQQLVENAFDHGHGDQDAHFVLLQCRFHLLR